MTLLVAVTYKQHRDHQTDRAPPPGGGRARGTPSGRGRGGGAPGEFFSGQNVWYISGWSTLVPREKARVKSRKWDPTFNEWVYTIEKLGVDANGNEVVTGEMKARKSELEARSDEAPAPDPESEPESDTEPDPALDLAPCPDRDRPPGDNPRPPCDRPEPALLEEVAVPDAANVQEPEEREDAWEAVVTFTRAHPKGSPTPPARFAKIKSP